MYFILLIFFEVKDAAAINYTAFQNLKELADACLQSCVQFKSTRLASAAARQHEQQMIQKEEERMRKDQAKAEEKKRKQDEREAEQKRKREEKESKRQKKDKTDDKDKDADDDNEDDEAEDRKNQRDRRGKGLAEIEETDFLLKNKIPGHECKVCSTVDQFVQAIVADDSRPVIWRLKRSVAKKTMEAHASKTGCNHQEILAISNGVKTEVESWIGEFAQKCEARLELQMEILQQIEKCTRSRPRRS